MIGLVAQFLSGTVVLAEVVTVDPATPAYEKTGGVSGNLNSVGSDTLNNLMAYWSEDYKTLYPNVNIQVEGKGSSTAPPALTQGTSQLGPMSREMKAEEADAFEKAYGYKPTPIRVAIDALAVFVHKDNPIKNLNLKDVDGIFSSTFKQGGADIRTWGAVLGPKPGWTNKPITLYGRNSASGTYGYFKEKAMKKGDYKSTVKEQPGSSAVVQGVGSDLGGIGYSGIGYVTSEVKALKLNTVEPTYENCLKGKYPLGRYLYIYVNKKPGEPLDSLQREFLKMVLSKQGQETVVKDGYFPLPADVINQELAKLS
ncbi:MAG: phosphate ABC transporter substrate-binding protein [Candidatus Omnitrophica bacterium]|nr:phosphate ABC transporter substrate-binding protein [Candidatus Omnitrophota bacterium]